MGRGRPINRAETASRGCLQLQSYQKEPAFQSGLFKRACLAASVLELRATDFPYVVGRGHDSLAEDRVDQTACYPGYRLEGLFSHFSASLHVVISNMTYIGCATVNARFDGLQQWKNEVTNSLHLFAASSQPHGRSLTALLAPATYKRVCYKQPREAPSAHNSEGQSEVHVQVCECASRQICHVLHW